MRPAERARVLACVTDLSLTGSKRVLVDGALGLDRERFVPAVLALSPVPEDDPLRRELEDGGVPLHVVPVRSRLDLRGGARLRRWLRDAARPDLVHTHCARSGAVVRLAVGAGAERPRVVVHFHGTLSRRAGRWSHRFLDRRLRGRTDLVLAPSAHALEVGRRRLALDGLPARVLGNGVRLDRVLAPRRSRDEVRRAWRVDASARVVLFVGRPAPSKGADLLIDAAVALAARDAAARIVVVAPLEGADGRALVARRDASPVADRVVLAGRDDDAPSCFPAADVVAVPSREEPFGLVAVEALASGTPVVASRVPGLHETLGDDAGVRWVEPGDAAALAAALAEVLAAVGHETADGRAHRVAAAQARAAGYGLPGYVAGLETAYADALRRPALAPPAHVVGPTEVAFRPPAP